MMLNHNLQLRQQQQLQQQQQQHRTDENSEWYRSIRRPGNHSQQKRGGSAGSVPTPRG